MSQFDEDRHIAAVFEEIGEGTRVLGDIGARYQFSNSAALLERGWSGTLVEAQPESCEELRAKFPRDDVNVLCTRATVMNVNALVPENAWFLSIDVDSVDWWLWANLIHRPALVVIETNPLPGYFVAEMNTAAKSRGYGCSVEAAKALAVMKGYTYIGRTEVNCFFVANEWPCQYRLPDVDKHVGSHSSEQNNVMR